MLIKRKKKTFVLTTHFNIRKIKLKYQINRNIKFFLALQTQSLKFRGTFFLGEYMQVQLTTRKSASIFG